MAAGGSNITVYGAIGVKILIAISKFVAAFFTGSSVMLAEGIHSFVDTGNVLLFLVGIKSSPQKPDDMHPFGYGKEVYFLSFVMSPVIFALGGGFIIYKGIHALQDPQVLVDPTWNYLVLGAAIILESVALYLVFRTFNRSRARSGNIVTNIIRSKDAATFAVIINYTASVVGLAIALLSIFLSQELGNPYIEGAASILIGLLLFTVAIFLARESKGFFFGDSATSKVVHEVEKILARNINVREWSLPQTVHFGPESILLILELDLTENLDLPQAEKTMESLRIEIKHKHPRITRVYIQTTGKLQSLDNDAL